LTEGLPDAFCVCLTEDDVRGFIPEAWNSAFEDLIGAGGEALDQSEFPALLRARPADAGAIRSMLKAVAEGRATDPMEFSPPPDDRRRVTMRVSAWPVEAIAPGRLACLIRDVTAERALERRVDRLVAELADREERDELASHHLRMETIGTLASGTAHEFNNILAGIMGYASLIRGLSDTADPRYRQAGVIEESARRAAALSSQLLSFSGADDRPNTAVELNVIAADAMAILGSISKHGIAVEMEASPDLPSIIGDADTLKQAILAIYKNALEAMPIGGTLTVRTDTVEIDDDASAERRATRPGTHIRLSISDTGVGMYPELTKRMFDPFFTTKGVGHGTGLGLSVVYGIVRNHQGFIEVDSSPGMGTTFHLHFPAAGVAEQAGGAPPRGRREG